MGVKYALVPIERVAAFSDAFYSIIATISVTKLAHLEDDEVDDIKDCDGDFGCTLFGVLISKLRNFLIFITTFVAVAVAWKVQAAVMHGVKKDTFKLVVTNILWTFLVVAWLPVTARIASTWDTENMGPIPFLVDYFLVWVCGIVMQQSMPGRAKSTKEVVFGLLPNLVGCGAGIILCLIGYPVLFLMGLILGVLITSRVLAVAKVVPQDSGFEMSTERLAAFTDGVHAIVATLIILDIQPPFVQDVPLLDWLGSQATNMVASCISIALVCTLWEAHYMYLMLWEGEVTMWLRTLNNVLCCIVCFLPMATSLCVTFPSKPMSWGTAALVILLVAITYMILLVYMRYAIRKSRGTRKHRTLTNPLVQLSEVNTQGAAREAKADDAALDKADGEGEGEGEEDELDEETKGRVWRKLVDSVMALTIGSLLGFVMAAVAPVAPGLGGIWMSLTISSFHMVGRVGIFCHRCQRVRNREQAMA